MRIYREHDYTKIRSLCIHPRDNGLGGVRRSSKAHTL